MPPTQVQGDSSAALINLGSGSAGSGSGGRGRSNSVIVGGIIGGAVVLSMIAILAVFLKRRKVRRRRKHLSEDEHDERQITKGSPYDPPQNFPPSPPPKFSGGSPGNFLQSPPPKFLGGSPVLGTSNFTYADLEQATNGFSKANLVGEGGFGPVFKGVLPDGKLVAVKQLKVGSRQGEREFKAEVEIISRVHHRHLVSLVGYCIAENQRMLVYEFVPNGTLESHLHGKGRAVMDWMTRLKIAIGAARGLAYLHEDCHPRIIHRDVKSANILLDDQFKALVSDFGLAKFWSDAHTHVTTRVMGTFGYLAYEYASTGRLTEKSDVYSFGVVLLELVTGRKAVDIFEASGDEALVTWTRPLLTKALEDGIMKGLIDPNLETNYNEREARRMIEAAAACVQDSAHKRPKLGQVVRALEGDAAADLYAGTSPGNSSSNDVEYESAHSKARLKKFEKLAFTESEEYGSEFSGSRSEYGLNQVPSSSDSGSSEDKKGSPIKKEDLIGRGDPTNIVLAYAQHVEDRLLARLRKKESRSRSRFSFIPQQISNLNLECRNMRTLKKRTLDQKFY